MPAVRPCRKSFVSGLSAMLLLFIATASLPAQVTKSTESVTGPGGWTIKFSYYPALEKLPSGVTQKLEEAPVIILIHGRESDRLLWDKTSAPPGPAGKPFAEFLQSEGYAVVAVDMRKFGDSKQEGQSEIGPNDYEAMVFDLVAVKLFIQEQHQSQQLNMRKLGIVALDDMAPVAATFAAEDWDTPPHDDHAILSERTPRGQDVRALVLVSPVMSSGRLQTTAPIRRLANPQLAALVGSPQLTPAILFVAGSKDTEGMKAARSLSRATSRYERSQLEQLDTNERSQNLFGSPRIRGELPILVFLKKNVLDLDVKWTDRRSRRDRD
ncbi:MAG: hypothetical protein R3B90_19260 [Planctomycetaceae bacterium]